MRGGRPLLARFWPRFVLLIAIAVVCDWCAPESGRTESTDPDPVQRLKIEYRELAGQHEELVRRQKSLLAEQREVADEIEKIKASDPGWLARMRLERLLARNLEVSRQLVEIARRLAENERRRLKLQDRIYHAYTLEMERVVKLLKRTANKKQAADLARRFYELQVRRQRWRSPTAIETDFSLFEVEVDPLDGPEELIAKAQLLEDLVTKIKAAISRIDKRIDRLRREFRLTSEMRDMVREMNLFQEGTRFHTGGRGDARPTEPTPEEPVVPDEEPGVHIPPLASDQGDVPGADRETVSIQREIKQLEAERKYLVQLAVQLSAKAAELRRRANQMRREERIRPPLVRPIRPPQDE